MSFVFLSSRHPPQSKLTVILKLLQYIVPPCHFSDYLFNNTDVVNGQRYARILADIEPLMEEGYSLYITGHRYIYERQLEKQARSYTLSVSHSCFSSYEYVH